MIIVVIIAMIAARIPSKGSRFPRAPENDLKLARP